MKMQIESRVSNEKKIKAGWPFAPFFMKTFALSKGRESRSLSLSFFATARNPWAYCVTDFHEDEEKTY